MAMEKARIKKQVENPIVLYSYETETDQKKTRCLAIFSAYIMAKEGEKRYSLLRTHGMEIFSPFGSALFESNGSFTPYSGILKYY
jgi:hypothetical protein